MAISLDSIRRSTLAPPRLIVYGVPGIGKTTLAAATPSPIFIPVEDGLGTLDVPTFPQPKTYDEVLDMIGTLVNEQHDYQTVVIDSLDKLEPMIWQHVCDNVQAAAGKKATRIEDYGYGKGYVHALSEWGNFLAGLDALRDKGMVVLCIAHSEVSKFVPPDGEEYDRYTMRLHKKADAAVADWADCVLFANYKVATVDRGDSGRKRAVSDGTRVLQANERAAFRAKNRYGMPNNLPMDWPTVEAYLRGEANTNNTNEEK